jgi:hypothetical protein
MPAPHILGDVLIPRFVNSRQSVVPPDSRHNCGRPLQRLRLFLLRSLSLRRRDCNGLRRHMRSQNIEGAGFEWIREAQRLVRKTGRKAAIREKRYRSATGPQSDEVRVCNNLVRLPAFAAIARDEDGNSTASQLHPIAACPSSLQEPAATTAIAQKLDCFR